jgi:hypothetical protein
MPAWGAVQPRVFLLSPASSSGARCRSLLAPGAAFELARRVRDEGAPLGDVMSFLSALYFRGKLSYAQRFATPLAPGPGVLVITAGRGLAAPETPVTGADLRAFARVAIDCDEPRYAEPLRSDAQRLRARLPRDAEIVLLGSIATPKYVDVLLAAFGRSLHFPGDFVGRGDMSRGGMLLRAARAGVELDYRSVDGAERRGRRPERLASLRAAGARTRTR